MILISGRPAETGGIENSYPDNGVERLTAGILSSSPEQYEFNSMEQLQFELKLCGGIVNAARRLDRSGMGFAVFRKSRCNPAYWNRTGMGGFDLKEGVKPGDAIRDIFENGPQYATECATAMIIVYYRALLEAYRQPLFDRLFPEIRLMNWHDVDRSLLNVAQMTAVRDYLPGDRRYFANPDVDPETPQWRGENVIDMGGGLYYGHGVGIHNAQGFIQALNENRKADAQVSAYLVPWVGRPAYKDLEALARQ